MITVGMYQRYYALLVFLLFSHHGVGFSRPGLAIREDADVVAFECVKQHLLSDVHVDLFLAGIVHILRLKQKKNKCLLCGTLNRILNTIN